MAKKTAAAPRRDTPTAARKAPIQGAPRAGRTSMQQPARRPARAEDIPGTAQHAARQLRGKDPRQPGSIKVRATKPGYYGHIRRHPGDVFLIRSEAEFSSKWMEPAERGERESVTLSNEIIRKKHDETLALKYGGGVAAGGADEGDDVDEEDDPLGARD